MTAEKMAGYVPGYASAYQATFGSPSKRKKDRRPGLDTKQPPNCQGGLGTVLTVYGALVSSSGAKDAKGASFVAENGGGPGVSLRKAEKAKFDVGFDP